MSVMSQLRPNEIRKEYNAWGFLLFILPIYIKLDTTGSIELNEYGFPQIHEFNWVPQPLFFLFAIVYGAIVYAGLSCKSYGKVPIWISGELE